MALRLVRQWRAKGVDAPLFVGRATGVLQAELAEDLDFITPKRAIQTGRLETLWMIWQLPRVIRTQRPDVLFCAGNTYTIVAVLMKLLLGSECPPIVAKVSNNLILPGLPAVLVPLYRLWARLQSRFIDHWVVMHPSMRGELYSLADAADVTVIPDPALTCAQVRQLKSWHREHAPQSGRRFVAIGRLVRQKNYPLMLQAFANSAAAADSLMILGDGPLRARLRRMAARVGVGDRVTFAGHVQDACNCLLEQDVLLLSSAYEGIPAVLVEAMTCGMPIIATDCGAGVRGLLEDYLAATICPTGDIRAFESAIRTLPPFTTSRNAASFDAKTYTIEAGASRYYDVFLAAAARKTTVASLASEGERQSLLFGERGLLRHSLDCPAPIQDQ